MEAGKILKIYQSVSLGKSFSDEIYIYIFRHVLFVRASLVLFMKFNISDRNKINKIIEQSYLNQVALSFWKPFVRSAITC